MSDNTPSPLPSPPGGKRALCPDSPEHWAAVRVHHFGHVARALAVADASQKPVQLVSTPDAVAAQGPSWFIMLCHLGARSYPNVQWTSLIDCANAPGHALAALRAGAQAVFLSDIPESALNRLRAIASRGDQRVQTGPLTLIDLAAPDAETALAAYFLRS